MFEKFKFPFPCSIKEQFGLPIRNKVSIHFGVPAQGIPFMEVTYGGPMASGTSYESILETAKYVVKACNLHELLVAVMECTSALDLPVGEGQAVLEKYGWDYSNRFDMPASLFIMGLRKKALEKLREDI